MFVTLINDCKSQNDIGRLKTRYSLLFPNVGINFVGIESSLGIDSTLEAAGNLIDIIDASNGREGVITLNTAPRGQIKEDGNNGSRFCYFWYKKTLIVSTTKGYSLSLVKKLGITNSINLLETNEVLQSAVANKLLDKGLSTYINNSQFRSFDFQPRVAKWLKDKIDLPHSKVSIKKLADPPSSVWLVDSFGNVKTTLLRSEINSRVVDTNLGQFQYYERLKDVPDGETAIYTGSSGLGNNRFLELATQNRKGSIAAKIKVDVGERIEIL